MLRPAVLRVIGLRAAILGAVVLRVPALRAAILRAAVLPVDGLRVAVLRTTVFRVAVLRAAVRHGASDRAVVLRAAGPRAVLQAWHFEAFALGHRRSFGLRRSRGHDDYRSVLRGRLPQPAEM